ncbi:MAG TPA: hypothetical protein VHK91_09785, partial [Flavisolibacter sp.]|nr:hypothetical protein [Flavisolibacter sp.]
MKSLMYFFVCILCITARAQSGDPELSNISKPIDILPPSPQVASLGQYGGINFGLATGTISYSLPVYTLTSGGLNLPISINYNSNGLRIDEVASRVGLGWSLNAGGVISRSILGNPDEDGQRVLPPATYPQRNSDLLNFMKTLSNDNGIYDGQPDIFSFNFGGYSGKFILDNSMNPVLLAPAPIKIEKDFLSSTWTFKITTPDGVQYFFGGDAAKEASKTFSSGVNCGKTYSNYIPTAWFLTSIVHPNGDQITCTYTNLGYNYKAAISETKFKQLTKTTTCPTGTGSCPLLQNSSCLSAYQHSTRLLTEINSSSGIKVKFIYSDRLDVGDKLLKTVEVYQPDHTVPFRLFDLNYQEVIATNFQNAFSTSDASLKYRPFLTEMIEKSTDGKLTRKIALYYNDKENL